MLNRSLYAAFLIFALLFLATMHMSPYPLDYLVKTIPIVCLAVLALCSIPGLNMCLPDSYTLVPKTGRNDL